MRLEAEDVKARADIPAVVKDLFPEAKHSGGHYNSKCPFHKGSKQNFRVNDTTGVYFCHNIECGETGSIFELVQKLRNLTFNEAVNHVASMNGIPVPNEFHVNPPSGNGSEPPQGYDHWNKVGEQLAAEGSTPGRAEDAEFWESHQRLTAIRDYAQAVGVNPYGPLGALIATAACRVSHRWRIPPAGSTQERPGQLLNRYGAAQLGCYVIAVGPPGGGKTSAGELAHPKKTPFTGGSGKHKKFRPPSAASVVSNLVHERAKPVKGSNKDGTPKKQPDGEKEDVTGYHQTYHHRTLAHLDEAAATLFYLGKDGGEQIQANIRILWTGNDNAGSVGADKDRTVHHLPAGVYTFALYMSVQIARAHQVVGAMEVGDPQRLLILPCEKQPVTELTARDCPQLTIHEDWDDADLITDGQHTGLGRTPECRQLDTDFHNHQAGGQVSEEFAELMNEIGHGEHTMLLWYKTAAALAIILGEPPAITTELLEQARQVLKESRRRHQQVAEHAAMSAEKEARERARRTARAKETAEQEQANRTDQELETGYRQHLQALQLKYSDGEEFTLRDIHLTGGTGWSAAFRKSERERLGSNIPKMVIAEAWADRAIDENDLTELETQRKGRRFRFPN